MQHINIKQNLQFPFQYKDNTKDNTKDNNTNREHNQQLNTHTHKKKKKAASGSPSILNALQVHIAPGEYVIKPTQTCAYNINKQNYSLYKHFKTMIKLLNNYLP